MTLGCVRFADENVNIERCVKFPAGQGWRSDHVKDEVSPTKVGAS